MEDYRITKHDLDILRNTVEWSIVYYNEQVRKYNNQHHENAPIFKIVYDYTFNKVPPT